MLLHFSKLIWSLRFNFVSFKALQYSYYLCTNFLYVSRIFGLDFPSGVHTLVLTHVVYWCKSCFRNFIRVGGQIRNPSVLVYFCILCWNMLHNSSTIKLINFSNCSNVQFLKDKNIECISAFFSTFFWYKRWNLILFTHYDLIPQQSIMFQWGWIQTQKKMFQIDVLYARRKQDIF